MFGPLALAPLRFKFHPEYGAGPAVGADTDHWAHPLLLGPATALTDNCELEQSSYTLCPNAPHHPAQVLGD
jgi:hypothetical protein